MTQQDDRTMLWRFLGDLSPCDQPIRARLVWRRNCGAYWLERLTLDLNGLRTLRDGRNARRSACLFTQVAVAATPSESILNMKLPS